MIKILKLLGLLSLMFIIPSCSNDEDNNTTSDTEENVFIGIDTDWDTEYPVALFNSTYGSIGMFSFDEDDKINSLEFISNELETVASFKFYENGLVESIAFDSCTIVFSNYVGHKVDVAIIDREDISMFKEIETETDWESLITTSRLAKSKQVATRGLILDMDNWLRNHEDDFKKIFLAIEECGHIKDAIDPQSWVSGNQFELMDRFGKIIKDSGKDWASFQLSMQKDAASNTLSNILDIREAYKLLKNGNFAKWEYYVLKGLLTNYSEYSDFCEKFFTYVIEKIDSWNNPNRDLGLGALTSGSGDLKATLTWNFYADIDLHATEPSGAHIYYNNPTSSYSDGFLDVDNRAGGRGATENIYWSNPENGIYEFSIDYYGPSTYNDMSQCGICKVTIMYKGVGKVYNISMDEYDYKNVTNITLPTGTYSRDNVETSNAPQVRIKVNYKEPKESKCRVIE